MTKTITASGVITYRGLELEYKTDILPADPGDMWTPGMPAELDGIQIWQADTDKAVDVWDIFTPAAQKEIENKIIAHTNWSPAEW